MKISILRMPTDEDWMAAKRRALVTVGKEPITPPDDEWKRRILRARHSPIRRLHFEFLLEDIPSYSSVHLVRHVHAQPYVKSQRNDRQKEYDRKKAPQDALVNQIWDMNGEALMTICNKRLCNQADETTRQIVALIRGEVVAADPLWDEFLVSYCDWYGRCDEMFPCGKCKNIGYKGGCKLCSRVDRTSLMDILPSDVTLNYCPNCGRYLK